MGLLVVVFVDDSLGCSLLDYDRLLVFGVVVLVDCGVCFFVQKEDVVVQCGVVVLIIVDNIDEQVMGGILGVNIDVKILVVSVIKLVGFQLCGQFGLIIVKFMVSI